MIDLRQGDCLEVMATLPDDSVDMVLTDPPYYKVKKDSWDCQWETPDEFLPWCDSWLAEIERVLKPNGSLYVFASPQMSARLELTIGKRFSVINNIVWDKTPHCGRHSQVCLDDMRSFFPACEHIIFAEHFNSDNFARGEASYTKKCDELRGFVFEPLRAYLDSEREKAGLSFGEVNLACGFREKGGMAGRHWFSVSQFGMPTKKSYLRIQETTGFFKREYEELRREYEELRRPFNNKQKERLTSVWDFAPVKAYAGKHPCEKPAEMLSFIVETSSRENAVVLDLFMGSGTTGVACKNLNRSFIGIERDPDYYLIAKNRIEKANREPVAKIAAQQSGQMELLA